jgi:hypothetical protein
MQNMQVQIYQPRAIDVAAVSHDTESLRITPRFRKPDSTADVTTIAVLGAGDKPITMYELKISGSTGELRLVKISDSVEPSFYRKDVAVHDNA